MTCNITASDVREVIGIGDDIISDVDITALIASVTVKAEAFFKIYQEPTKVIEIKDGNNKNQIIIKRPYLWKVLELKTTNDTVDLADITIKPYS